MGVFDTVRGRKTSQVATHDATFTNEKDLELSQPSSDSDSMSLEARENKEVENHPDEVTGTAHLGIQKAEAAALVWSKKAAYATYAWIWFCFFMLAFQSSVLYPATVRAENGFASAPAITTALILANIVGGVLKLPIAKMLNLWGRAEAFVLFFVVYLIGMVVLASSNGPNSYAAGYVIYWIGYDALYVIMDVFIADTSGLQKRAFTFAFASTPFICTAFTGPLAAQAIINNSGWQWAIGIFCIIQPFVFLPLAVVFKYYSIKAQKMGLFVREPSGRTTLQSIVHYFHEFDAFVLFLLPFTLQTQREVTYGSATFIAMLVVGFCLFFVFAAWEKWGTRVHFINYQLLRERTVLGSCLLSLVYFFSFYCWDPNFYSFVTVVYNLDIADATYMNSIWEVGSTFCGVLFGIYIYYSKHFKYACLFFGLPLEMLGAGLMVYFRSSLGGIGYIVMCQIFIAFGGGMLVIGNEMAMMAAADREGVPMMLSIIYLFNAIGTAFGTAVSSAIYSNTWTTALSSRLPADMQSLVLPLYNGGYNAQQKYPPGSLIRDAVDYAWGRMEYYNAIAGVCILVVGFPAIAMWKNYDVTRKQNKGVMI